MTRDFRAGGGRPRFRNSNGLTATKMLGANFATQTDKLELGGSARYNFSDRDAISTNYSERFLQNGNSYSNSNSKGRNKNTNFNADFRLEWKPDTLTNIIFRPIFLMENLMGIRFQNRERLMRTLLTLCLIRMLF